MQTDKQPWTLKRLLAWTSDYLDQAQVDQARLCAELLLAEALGCKRIELYMNFDKVPNETQLSTFRQWVKRCVAHEPVAYLLGSKSFYGLELKVTPAVLIPRPETEVLVSCALDFLSQSNRPKLDVLDLCTGSGCVALAIAQNFVEAEITAADISPEALAVAKENGEKYDVGPRITWAQGDLFAAVDNVGKGVFDLIVSNPPYIAADVYETLDKNVKDYEPRAALLAGIDGLDFYRRIAAEAETYLADNGALMVEVAYDQAPAVIELFTAADYLKDVETVRDDLGHQRVVKAIRQ